MYWEDVRVWACWNHSFGMHLSYLEPVSWVFTSWDSSGCSLMSAINRWQVFFPSWVSSGLTSSPSVVAAIANDCDGPCLLIWQEIFKFSHPLHHLSPLLHHPRSFQVIFKTVLSLCSYVSHLSPSLQNLTSIQSRTFTWQLPSLANSSDGFTSQLHKPLPVSGHPHRRVPWPEMLFPTFLPLHPVNPQVLSSSLKTYFSWDFSGDPMVKVPMHGAWVPSLVEELRFHVLCSVAKVNK